ncbi:MAG TPA: exonuclease domain-containing protein [Solirubrobacteraceae bacterium]|jgi:DNA polymerase-3 subunit epsilon|nr:exonuclease domain-containing protein [Solirubrobacteraceae bacterium]
MPRRLSWPARRSRQGSPAGTPGADAYRSASLPDGATPWRSAGWAALDFELTGLDPRRDEIISFGVIPIDEGRVRAGAAVSGLVRPEREVGEASIRVHGIRAADLDAAPSLSDSLGVLLPVLAGRGLIAHSAEIERAFLGRALRERGLRLRGPVVDTEVLGRLWLGRRRERLPRRVSLSDLAGQLGVPAERPHDAVGDALTTAQLFIVLAALLDAEQAETVASLSRAHRRLEATQVFGSG